MRYLIDGHNLIARVDGISLADPYDEDKLIRLLARWRWRRNNPPVTVVFDPGDVAVSGRRRLKRSGINVRYASYGSDADAVLMRMIDRSPQPGQLTVVTSDRALQSVAQQRGARTIASDAFAEELATRPEPTTEGSMPEEALSPEEVEKWLKLFQDSEEG